MAKTPRDPAPAGARLGMDLTRLIERIVARTVSIELSNLQEEVKRTARRLDTIEGKVDRMVELLEGQERAGAGDRAGGEARQQKPVCKHEGCKKPVRAKGYCMNHYQLWRRGRLPDTE